MNNIEQIVNHAFHSVLSDLHKQADDLNKKAKKAMDLESKLKFQRAEKEIRSQITEHRLNCFDIQDEVVKTISQNAKV